MRVAAVQFDMRPAADLAAFAERAAFFVAAAAGQGADLVVFPELCSSVLLDAALAGKAAARALAAQAPQVHARFRALAREHRIDIVSGSHFGRDGRRVLNVATLHRRDGSMAEQRKLHITPSERRAWGIAGGDDLAVFATHAGRIAIVICYDVEFPELARVAAAQGAEVLCVPFSTDLRSGYLRVRACAQARCIEDHVYAVLAGTCGVQPLPGCDVHWAQSCVLTPSDTAFARDGIAAEATPNVESLIVADLDLAMLRRQRRAGTVRTWLDRRTDLYRVAWRGGTPREV
jgi:predicted amidohydrolase